MLAADPVEPDMLLHATSPPPLGDGDDGETGSEDDEFGSFGGFSCSADSAVLKQSAPTIKPPNCSFNHTPEQTQPTPAVNSGAHRGQEAAERQHSTSQSSLHLMNGSSERGSGTQADSTTGAPREESGFADFTVFTEQAAYPWCCGFSTLDSIEQQDVNVGDTTLLNNIGKKPCDSKQWIIMDSEPRLCGSHQSEETVYTKVNHCEKRHATNVQPSQDYHPPQDAAATLDSLSVTEQRWPGECQAEIQHSVSLHCLKMSDSEDTRTASMYDSATEDLPSFYHDDEEGTFLHADSLLHHSMTNFSIEEPEAFHRDQSVTQGISATSNSEPEMCAEGCLEHHRNQEYVHKADKGGRYLGGLPPSDSFADFCSASTQEEGEGSWEEFQDQKPQVAVKLWPPFRQDSCLQITGNAEQDRTELCGRTMMDSWQASLACRVQQIFQASFPAVPTVEREEEEVLSLDALLHIRSVPDSGSEEMPELAHPIAQWVQQGMWFLQLDVHSIRGLQFQWGSSHANQALLRCLGVDSGNIVFGVKNQPVVVPAFASSLEMLEPTKESVSTVCSHFVITQAPPGSQDIPDLSTHPVQRSLPSSPLNWINRGLSSSQDGTSPRRTPYFWSWK
ncbi:uncharacterized protein LOC117523851 [Thalassophryne amazonica]|uniref:uncharacterized protein LOC117523851 n=1 Tax=Thalassophryne amazonica TaxID=390379 RepID=UPI0014725E6B|nr:uncharacterized protein LOC117523851 [Thalassophryne amazonica]